MIGSSKSNPKNGQRYDIYIDKKALVYLLNEWPLPYNQTSSFISIVLPGHLGERVCWTWPHLQHAMTAIYKGDLCYQAYSCDFL